jgi:hypothetical protein
MHLKPCALEQRSRSQEMLRVGHQQNRPDSSLLQKSFDAEGLLLSGMRRSFGEDRF